MASPTRKWHWRETTPGIYKRALDECETFYRVCTREESGCFPVTGCAAFTYPEHPGYLSSSESTNGRDVLNSASAIEEAFRKAWATLRFVHPSLAFWVENEGEELNGYNRGQLVRIYSSITADTQTQSKELDIWLSKTFSVVRVEGPHGAEEWFRRDAPDFEQESAYLIHQAFADHNTEHGSKKATIFLRCAHDITDGIGILHLLQQPFEYARQAL